MKYPKPTHELKTLDKYYRAVLQGAKNFEIRFNDRNFKVNDILLLKEIDKDGNYTGRQLYRIVTYILKDAVEYGLKEGFVILGIKPAIQ
ncbi:MAG: DUF3850 domain-containing protein [Bacteroidota bacterium]